MIHSKRKSQPAKSLPLWHPTGLFNKPCQNKIITSAVRYSKIAALYTAAVAPTRPWLVVRVFRCLWIRPTGNWNIKQPNSQHHWVKHSSSSLSYLAEGYAPADQLFVIWRLLSSWLFHCPFQLFLQPAEAQEEYVLRSLIEGEKTTENEKSLVKVIHWRK